MVETDKMNNTCFAKKNVSNYYVVPVVTTAPDLHLTIHLPSDPAHKCIGLSLFP